METTQRNELNGRIRSFFLAELKKARGEDIALLNGKLDEFLRIATLKDAVFCARYQIRMLRNKAQK
jgi:hypothetical protein